MPDRFAEIAAKESLYRVSELTTPTPLPPETRVLPWSDTIPEKLEERSVSSTQAETLAKELVECRKRYESFLQDLAPPLPSPRKRQILHQFQWRVETPSDRKGLTNVTKGEGHWEEVTIPHYGGPLGHFFTLYRRVFSVDVGALAVQQYCWLHISGADYRASISINGTFVGEHSGFFAPFEFDITEYLIEGDNVLVVRLENDYTTTGSTGDNPEVAGKSLKGGKIYAATGPGWDDPQVGWHHCPPGMGLYQSVYLEYRPVVFISDLSVRPLLDTDEAEAWIEVCQSDLTPRQISFDLQLYGQNFNFAASEILRYSPTVQRAIGMGDNLTEARLRALGKLNESIPQHTLRGTQRYLFRFPMKEARLWELDTPWLYQLQVALLDTDQQSLDTKARQFGMRSFRIDENSTPKNRMYLNGREIRLRGANTMGHEQQCVIKGDYQQLVEDILLAKLCNMNFLRLTQRPVQEEVYDYCDRLGLMIQTDLPLFGCLNRSLALEAVRQASEMERLVRSHPCVILLSYINEPFPAGDNMPQRNLTRTELEEFFTMANQAVHWENPDRAIKAVDGDYDPPGPGLQDRHCYNLWYNGHGLEYGRLNKGWWMPVAPDSMIGCGEFGAEGLDPPELMYRRYPKAWLPPSATEPCGDWSPNAIVSAQTGAFHYMFFDTPDTLEEWCRESQEYQALAVGNMARAFRRENRMNSFAVHLFIDAFPAGWMKAIMDSERVPKAAYFAYQEALKPLLADIRTDRHSWFGEEWLEAEAWVCNDGAALNGGQIVYSLELKNQFLSAGILPVAITANQAQRVGLLRSHLPKVRERQTATLYLSVLSAENKVLAKTQQHFSVFPAPSSGPITGDKPGELLVLGPVTTEASHLAETLRYHVSTLSEGIAIEEKPLIVISDANAYLANKSTIDQAVQRGATAVFLPLAEGHLSIGDGWVEVRRCAMNALHFVSRKTGHAMVAGFEKKDFSFWYDETLGYLSPLLSHTFTGDAQWIPILRSGNADSTGKWGPALAAAERRFGEGRFRVCQVSLAGRLKTNPPARIFAERLLQKNP